MVNVGIVGVGFMGMIHYLSYGNVRGVKVKALCENTQTHRLSGDWRDIKGNFGPPGAMMDLSAVDTYTDLDKMLAEPEIDVVDICLPPGLHAPMAVKALLEGTEEGHGGQERHRGRQHRMADQDGEVHRTDEARSLKPHRPHLGVIVEVRGEERDRAAESGEHREAVGADLAPATAPKD